ncbi:MAG: ion transporter [Victivallaceae bacterium]|nr:ion transporter [Victivallaceae bacterium]
MSIKGKVFEIIQPGDSDHVASKIFDCVIIALIAMSIISVFLQTFDLPSRLSRGLYVFEVVSTYVFTLEYLLRIWTADLLHPDMPPFRARLVYIRSGMAVVDLLAILPFYLPMILPFNLLGLRAVRLVRLLRIFKFNRYSDAMTSVWLVIKKKLPAITAALVMVFILLVMSSLFIYFAEHDAQPDKFENAFSGLWWAVATLTTVGYGDIYPITICGKILGTVIALLGIGVVAIPTGILSSGFIEHLNKHEDEEDKDDGMNFCPHCGRKLK